MPIGVKVMATLVLAALFILLLAGLIWVVLRVTGQSGEGPGPGEG